MAGNKKSIQILRGSKTYDPSTSDEVLLDGQPFYSKKTRKLYIGDGKTTLSNLKSLDLGEPAITIKLHVEDEYDQHESLISFPSTMKAIVDWGDDNINDDTSHYYKQGDYVCKIYSDTTTFPSEFIGQNESIKEIILSEKITEIEEEAIDQLHGLEKIYCPGVIDIGRGTFYNSTSLQYIYMPKVEYIGENAFDGHFQKSSSSLSSIVIPKTCSYVGRNVFTIYDNLTIYCEAEEQPSGWTEDWNSDEQNIIRHNVIWGYKEKDYPEIVTSITYNMEDGKGNGSFQQVADGVADGFAFAEYNADGSVKSYKNPTAMEWISDDVKAYIDSGGKIPYGAEGNFSSAIGGKSYAYGKRSHAEGTTTIAFGDYSHAEGNNSVTLGANSHAEGKQTTTLQENAHAEGFDTFAEGYISHSEGYQTHAEGSVSHAEGQGTHAEGDQSHAEGNGTHAEGHYSHAEGYGTHAKGKASHTSGEGTIAEGDYQTVVGTYNPPVDTIDIDENTKAKVLFMVGNGISDEERSVAFAVLDNGEALSSYEDKPSSDASLINLRQFYDLLWQETTSTLIDGRLPFSVQPKPHIGEGNPDSIADYSYDFVFGKGLRTTNEYETVFGKYNTYSDADWQNPKALFVIGNGTSNSSRSNAFEVKEDGTAKLGEKLIATEDYVNKIISDQGGKTASASDILSIFN